MTAPHELTLEHPVELDGNRYERLAVADYAAIANFNTANPGGIILSLSHVFGVPRRVIRHLDRTDAGRAGDVLRDLLDEYTNSVR